MTDWSIAAQGNPIAPVKFDPVGMATDMAQLQSVRAVAEERRRKVMAQARLQQLSQQYGDDQDELIKALGREFPFEAAELGEKIQSARKEGAQAVQAETKATRERFAFGLSLMQGVTPENYQARREMAVAIGGEAASKLLGEQYDEAQIQGAISTIQDTDKYLAAKETAAQFVLDGKHQEGVWSLFAGASNQAQWDDATREATRAGFGSLARQLGPQYSPEAQAEAAKRTISTEKQADLALKQVDDARQDRRDAASAEDRTIDNKRADAQLAISRAQLGVSQGHLRVAQERAKDGGDEPLVPVVGRDGKPVLMRRSKAEGMAPASSAAAAGTDKAKPDVGRIMGEIEALSTRINTSDSGPMSNATGLFRRGMAAGNMDNDVSEYQSLIEGMIPMVARSVGHTGVLTQQDVDSVRKLFPLVNDNKTLARNKIARVKSLLNSAGTATPAAPAAATAKKADPLGIR